MTEFTWHDAVIPVAVFLATLIATVWLRQVGYSALKRWMEKIQWQGDELLLQALRGPSILWCLLISAGLAVAVSDLSTRWKDDAADGLWTLLILSLGLTALNLAGKFIPFYGERWKLPRNVISLSNNVARVVILIVAGLMLLDVWGAPTSPVLLVIAIAAIAALLASRGALPNLFAWFQLSATGHIKVGDYIKLETGEEGYVMEMDWRNTKIKALDESTVLIPNSKLMHSTVINYGRPLKKAKEPFRFYSRVHLKELTGLTAKNLQELATILKTVPDPIIYYHTHQFLEEHHYLTPEPANDFALWVRDALGNEVLGERLAAIDTFEFAALGALRERLVAIIEEHLTLEAQYGDGHRNAPEGREFHFIKSVSAILSTPYVVRDLREFVEALRKISLGALYFHVFESRLRLSRGSNDFSIWIEESLGDKELAGEIARLDPYNYTLEGLRSSLIRIIEKRIK
ncbi:MAG: mechanosensitive ion channel family protein [Chloroflexi bacterium]|nr:mechanosensitive ion channel family protein [Chloroflexota bacterium]